MKLVVPAAIAVLMFAVAGEATAREVVCPDLKQIVLNDFTEFNVVVGSRENAVVVAGVEVGHRCRDGILTMTAPHSGVIPTISVPRPTSITIQVD